MSELLHLSDEGFESDVLNSELPVLVDPLPWHFHFSAMRGGLRSSHDDETEAPLMPPWQMVVSGENGALETAGERIKAAGAKRFVPLKVAGAFHSPVMQPAADRLAADLAEVSFATPRVPVVSNVDAKPHALGADWTNLLSAQLSSPVRWRQSLLSGMRFSLR